MYLPSGDHAGEASETPVLVRFKVFLSARLYTKISCSKLRIAVKRTYLPSGEKVGEEFWKAQISSLTMVSLFKLAKSIRRTSSRPLRYAALVLSLLKLMSRLFRLSWVSCLTSPLPSAEREYQLRYPFKVWLKIKVLLSFSHMTSDTRSP